VCGDGVCSRCNEETPETCPVDCSPGNER